MDEDVDFDIVPLSAEDATNFTDFLDEEGRGHVPTHLVTVVVVVMFLVPTLIPVPRANHPVISG